MSVERRPANNIDGKNTESFNATSGIKAVLEKSLQSYDKLPMLEIIFEKFIRQLSTSLRNLTSILL